MDKPLCALKGYPTDTELHYLGTDRGDNGGTVDLWLAEGVARAGHPYAALIRNDPHHKRRNEIGSKIMRDEGRDQVSLLSLAAAHRDGRWEPEYVGFARVAVLGANAGVYPAHDIEKTVRHIGLEHLLGALNEVDDVKLSNEAEEWIVRLSEEMASSPRP